MSLLYAPEHHSSLQQVCLLMWTFLGQITSDQQDVVLLPQLILKDTMRNSSDLNNVMQQLQPQSWMISQTYANYTMDPLQVFFSFSESPNDSYVTCMVSVMLFAFCFQLLMQLPLNHRGDEPLRFATLQPEFTLCKDMYLLVMGCAPDKECTEWLLLPLPQVGGNLQLFSLSPSHSSNMVGHIAIGSWQSHLIPSHSIHGGEGFLFQVVYHPMTQLTSNLLWGLNWVNLVWWSAIKLMNLLAPGWWSISLLSHNIYPGFMVRHPHLPTSHLNQSVSIIHFWTRQWRTLSMVWIQFSQTLSTCIPW